MKHKLVWILLMATIPAFTFIKVAPQASATSTNYNNLIDDALFDDTRTMTASQIDAFLNGFSSSCISSNSGFRVVDPTGYNPSQGFLYGSNVTAGKAIYDAAQAYELNPQVLLATLQKEQSLVTGGSSCGTLAYAGAMGYGCPDGGTTHTYTGVNLYTLNGHTVTSVSGTCVSSKAQVGFSQQLIHAAWLLKFDRMRAEGNVTWAIIKTNWDNSDDLDTYYSGYMTQGTFQRCSSCSATFFDGLAVIDGTSVHIDDGATASLYVYTPHKSGNDHFDTIFISWFGSVRATPFIRISGTTAVYILGASNTYYWVQSGTELRTYGYGTVFLTIDTVGSSYLSGLTNGGTLPLIAQFDGDATTYLVDNSSTHKFANPTMLATFGYGSTQPAILPAWVFNRLPHFSDMQAVVKQLSAPEIYYVSSDKKLHIGTSAAYHTLGSPVYSSQPSVTLSNAYVASIPLGPPILVPDTITHTSDTNIYGYWNGVHLLGINTSVGETAGIGPDYTATSIALNQLPASTDPAINKLAQDSSGKHYVLDTKQKLAIPDDQLANLGLTSGDFTSADDGYLGRFTSMTMSSVVRPIDGTATYNIQDGKLYHIYSLSDLFGLGFSYADILRVNSSTLGLFTPTNLQLFAPGKLLRIDKNPEVFVVGNGFMKLPIKSRAVFDSFKFLMSDVVSVPAATLNGYTTTSDLALINKDSLGGVWLVDQGNKHDITTSLLGSSYYNIDASTLNILPDSILNRLPSGSSLSDVLRIGNQATVYEIVDGQKRPFSSRIGFETSGHSWSDVLSVSAYFASSFPTGSPIP